LDWSDAILRTVAGARQQRRAPAALASGYAIFFFGALIAVTMLCVPSGSLLAGALIISFACGFGGDLHGLLSGAQQKGELRFSSDTQDTCHDKPECENRVPSPEFASKSAPFRSTTDANSASLLHTQLLRRLGA